MNQNIHTLQLLHTQLRQTHWIISLNLVLTFPCGKYCYSHFVEEESKHRKEAPSPRPHSENMALSSMLGPLLWLSFDMWQQGQEIRAARRLTSSPGQTPFYKWGIGGPEKPRNLSWATRQIGCWACIQAAWGEGEGKPHTMREADSYCPI